MELQNSIKEKRARLSITQDRLAKEVGLSRVSIGKIERGTIPDLIHALKIAEALEVSIHEIFKLKNDDKIKD